MIEIREKDGVRLAFITAEEYFAGFHTPSMYSVSQETKADAVFLLDYEQTVNDLSEDTLERLFAFAKEAKNK